MSAFDGPFPPPEVPVPAQVVALLRLPVAVTPLYGASKALTAAYGPDLKIRTDLGLDGWLAVARPEVQD